LRCGVFSVVALGCFMALPPVVCAEQVVYKVWPGADGDCADRECHLQAALDAAESAPGVDHEIRLAQGSYGGNYLYLPAGDHTGDLTVEGVTLRQGVAGGAAGEVDNWGGGLFALTNSTATLVVRRNILENNRAASAGGGCLLLAGGPEDGDAEGILYLEDPIIRHNVATGFMDGADQEGGDGGGCNIIVRGLAVVRNNLVHDNRAGGADSGQTFAGFGGGLYVEIMKGSAYLVNNYPHRQPGLFSGRFVRG